MILKFSKNVLVISSNYKLITSCLSTCFLFSELQSLIYCSWIIFNKHSNCNRRQISNSCMYFSLHLRIFSAMFITVRKSHLKSHSTRYLEFMTVHICTQNKFRFPLIRIKTCVNRMHLFIYYLFRLVQGLFRIRPPPLSPQASSDKTPS